MKFLLKMRFRYLMFLLLTITQDVESFQVPAWDIYCEGQILDTVQTSGIFEDPKTFIDMKMKLPISEIFLQFQLMMNATKGKPHTLQIRRFVRKCFLSPGSEFERCKPLDWVPEPKIIKNITDISIKKWVLELNSIWKQLCRKTRLEVRDNPNSYSVIYIPNPFIIPGGRNEESKYWDSYWIILGLLLSDMDVTAKGIIENLLFLTEQYGFVPNGNRIYYLGRSNVPLLIPMVGKYFKKTGDVNFVERHITTLEREFNFWMKCRVKVFKSGNKTYKLARYGSSNSNGPRPEEYVTNVNLGKYLKTDNEKSNFYQELKTASETGWDLSSRWFLSENNTGKIQDIMVRSIIPVDLNAVIYLNAKILSEFFFLLNMEDKSDRYKQLSEDWKEAVNRLLWSEEDGMWFDYDMKTKKLRKKYYISNTVPLWSQCYDDNQTDVIATKVVQYLKKTGIENFKGGTPPSLTYTGLHWDFPNAIPSVQHMLIMGLETTKNQEATEFAYTLAYNWIRANYMGYSIMKSMYDSYDARKPGTAGGGNYHLTQAGYGWTNGVILDLLYVYGKRISVRDIRNSASLKTLSSSKLYLFLYIFIIFV